MAQIEILSEQGGEASRGAGGWVFAAQAIDDAGALHRFTLRLSWADYNLWSPDGSDSPERIAEAVLAFLISRKDIRQLPASFDASIARRWFADADEAIPALI